MAIAAWRNMARDDGHSPSQLFFGRIRRQRLPMLAAQTDNGSKCIESKDAISKASTESRNSKTKDCRQPGANAMPHQQEMGEDTTNSPAQREQIFIRS